MFCNETRGTIGKGSWGHLLILNQQSYFFPQSVSLGDKDFALLKDKQETALT